MSKRKPPKKRKLSKKGLRGDPPVSLHPLKFTDAVAALLGHRPKGDF